MTWIVAGLVTFGILLAAAWWRRDRARRLWRNHLGRRRRFNGKLWETEGGFGEGTGAGCRHDGFGGRTFGGEHTRD